MAPAETRVNALVSLLADHGPESLRGLRQRFPLEILRAGGKLGPEETDLEAAMALAIEALEVALGRSAPNEDRLRRRLHAAKQLRVGGASVAAVTGAGLIAALGWQSGPAVTLPTATVNLLGTLLTLYANYLETVLYGGDKSLVDVFERLVDTSVKAESLRDRLRVLQRTLGESDAKKQCVSQANDLAAELRRMERLLWGRQRGRLAAA